MKYNSWLQYIEQHVIKKQDNELLIVEEDLSNVLNEINDDVLKNNIFATLIYLDDYNPYTDILPLKEFDENTQKTLKQIIKYIKTHYYINNDVRLNNGLWGKIIYKSKSFNIKDYANDLVVAFNSNEFNIYFLNDIFFNYENKCKVLDFLNSLVDDNSFVLENNRIRLCGQYLKKPIKNHQEYKTSVYEDNIENLKNTLEKLRYYA